MIIFINTIEWFNKYIEEKQITALPESPPTYGLKVTWQDILLPKDFDILMKYALSIILKCSLINIDFCDIVTVYSLDLENKTCNNGHLKILEISGNSTVLNLKQIFKNITITECKNCLIIFNSDFSICEVSDYTSIIQEVVGDTAGLFCRASYDNQTPKYIKLKIIFNIDNTLT